MTSSYLTRCVFAGVVTVAGSSAIVAPASAAQCGPREQIAGTLARDFNEKPIGMGLSAAGSVLVVYASPKGGWTATVVSPAGVACVVDVGDGWTGISVGEVANLK